jgi:nucleotide-binding universal stress UspA family protein
MGSVGRSGLDKFLLGSVAEKVVRNSNIPVLTVPKEAV